MLVSHCSFLVSNLRALAEWPALCMFSSEFHRQASFWSWKAAKFRINELPRQNSCKEYSAPKEWKCEEFCLQTRLGGEICWSDVIMHKGHILWVWRSNLVTMETSMVPRSEGLRPSMIRHGTSYCAEDTWPCDVQHPQCSVFFCLCNQSLYVLGWKNYASN